MPNVTRKFTKPDARPRRVLLQFLDGHEDYVNLKPGELNNIFRTFADEIERNFAPARESNWDGDEIWREIAPPDAS